MESILSHFNISIYFTAIVINENLYILPTKEITLLFDQIVQSFPLYSKTFPDSGHTFLRISVKLIFIENIINKASMAKTVWSNNQTSYSEFVADLIFDMGLSLTTFMPLKENGLITICDDNFSYLKGFYVYTLKFPNIFLPSI